MKLRTRTLLFCFCCREKVEHYKMKRNVTNNQIILTTALIIWWYPYYNLPICVHDVCPHTIYFIHFAQIWPLRVPMASLCQDGGNKSIMKNIWAKKLRNINFNQCPSKCLSVWTSVSMNVCQYKCLSLRMSVSTNIFQYKQMSISMTFCSDLASTSCFVHLSQLRVP